MNLYPLTIREGEVINRVREDWFDKFDTVRQIKDIDFSVYEPEELSLLSEPYPYLWAEAKKGNSTDMEDNLVQLALTIGKHRLYAKMIQPVLIAAFDAERICFLEYERVMALFSEPWMDWNLTPSDHQSEHFQRAKRFLQEGLTHRMTFNWMHDAKDLKRFIKVNFTRRNRDARKIEINRTSFVSVYFKWCEKVKPSIAVDWSMLAKYGVYDRDFYLADLISKDGKTLRDNLIVTLNIDSYKMRKDIEGMGFFADVHFRDGQKAYNLFWNNYKRPPKKEYHGYILDRADLLVPEDKRAYDGAYYTPKIWVEKAHMTLHEIFGDCWQDDYYVWDCAAGSGNLLRGLANPYRVYASTNIQGDVDRMHSAIDSHSLQLLKGHVFQFDFLNDDLDGPKVPVTLKEIIASPEKRRKLVVLINPPWAEAGDKDTVKGTGANKKDVALKNKTYEKYKDRIGIAAREVYVQFFMRVYSELSGCILAEFSKLKHLTAPNFIEFRNAFQAHLFGPKFVVNSKSFENVPGSFPVGFFVWDTSIPERFSGTEAEYLDKAGNSLGMKRIVCYDGIRTINDWMISTRTRGGQKIGFMNAKGADFQNQNYNFIINDRSLLPHPRGTVVTDTNFLEACVYYAVVHSMKDNWINDRDLFLEPKPCWLDDKEFVTDCIVYTLFSNRIKLADGINHWIPFSEEEVCSPERFSSHVVRNLLTCPGALVPATRDTESLFGEEEAKKDADWFPLSTLSTEAGVVFETGRKIWTYYLSQPDIDVNASFYDIEAKFQGRKSNGDLSGHSEDMTYEQLRIEIGHAKRVLEKRIAPKSFEFGFLIK